MTATEDAVAVVEPAGYHILVRLKDAPETTKGSVIVPGKTREAEQLASVVGQVMAMGPLAYRDREKFPTGEWCRVGDWIMMRQYSGTRFNIDKEEYRLINDDTVEAVIHEPGRVTQVGSIYAG